MVVGVQVIIQLPINYKKKRITVCVDRYNGAAVECNFVSGSEKKGKLERPFKTAMKKCGDAVCRENFCLLP